MIFKYFESDVLINNNVLINNDILTNNEILIDVLLYIVID